MFSLLFANSLRENPTIYLLKQNQVIRSINASFYFLLVVEIKSNGYSPTHHCRFYVNQTPSKCFLTVTDGVLGATPSEDMPQSSLTVRHHVKVHNARFDFSLMVRSFSRWFEGSNSCVRGINCAGAINPTSTKAT